jgi:hypothetical protein
MDHQRLRRRDRGRDRVTRLTKAVAIVAGVGALLVSVGAARSNPGRFTSPPKVASTVASGRQARHHRHIRSDAGGSSTVPQQPTPAPPAATNPPPVTNPPAVTTTPAPPVVVSGGS